MNENEMLATGITLTAALTLLWVGYRHDIEEARYFAAVRRAAQHPYADRDWHRRFARRHKLFWKPCPECLEHFGGHEMTGKTIPHLDPDKARKGQRLPICPACSVQKRAPAPVSGPVNIVKQAKKD